MRVFKRRSEPAAAADPKEHERRQKIADDYQDRYGWWHSIDIGHGVVTPGYKTAEHLKTEVASMRFPDVRGKTVLDIGAWDGFYSYEAERRGASRVVALDHFVWSVDAEARDIYLGRCRKQGLSPRPYETVPEIWRPHELPGKRGFDIAHDLLESKVEAVVDDFMSVDIDGLGSFDVVFFLGVLYHLKHPVAALERLRRLTREVAVIETEAMEVAGCEEQEMWESFSADQLLGDITNWWAPNRTALAGMCKAAGFRETSTTHRLPSMVKGASGPQHYRLFLQARV